MRFVWQVVQGIISELESQGALPRSNSRVSSLATCCGPRLVGLSTSFILVSLSRCVYKFLALKGIISFSSI